MVTVLTSRSKIEECEYDRLRGKLAKHHQVQIPNEMLDEAVDLEPALRDGADFLPDKAIDVIDEAASLLKPSSPIKLSRKDKLARQLL